MRKLTDTDGDGIALLRAVLDVLAGRQADAALLKQIPNADKLRAARPEDLVLISASSHGYMDSDGIFYLVPSDSGTADLKSPEFRCRCGSRLMSCRAHLRDVDAGELVLIVDACHSAAAIEGTDFKPWPMGRSRWGSCRMTGMRILTATQAEHRRAGKGRPGLADARAAGGRADRLAGRLQAARQSHPTDGMAHVTASSACRSCMRR